MLADLVLVAHAAFVAFALGGGLLVLRRRWAAWLHLPALAWGAAIELAGGTCPLTPLEDRLRGSATSHSADFIERGVSALLYPARLTRADQIALGVGLLLVNAAIYGLVLRRATRRRGPTQ
ncbi:MAG: DUF2784 domain-containing protein [Myxococcota bacterium]